MAMTPGFPQQQRLLTSAVVRSAPHQQHGAHMWRSSALHPPDAAQAAKEEKSFDPARER
jgi:hypothetical protein